MTQAFLITYLFIAAVTYVVGKGSVTVKAYLGTGEKVTVGIGAVVFIWLATDGFGTLGVVFGMVVAISAWGAGRARELSRQQTQANGEDREP